MNQSSSKPSARRLAWVTIASFVVAVAVVVGVVLPAEYGLDPLGTGSAFGLLGLSRVQPLAPEETEYEPDVLELELAPTEWGEATYRLAEGASMLFSWEAPGGTPGGHF